MTYTQTNGWTYETGIGVATLAVMAALRLWAVVVSVMLSVYVILLSALEASVPWLLLGATLLALQCTIIAPFRWRRARRSVRRMRTAAARGH